MKKTSNPNRLNTQLNPTIYNTLFQAFRPYAVKIIILLILGFSGRFLLLYNSKIIALTLDQSPLITHELLQNLLHKLIMVLGISLVITGLYRVLFSCLCSYAVSRIYDETTLRVSRFPLTFFDLQPAGKITSRFSSDYGNVFRLFGGPVAEFFSILFDLLSIVFISISVHPLFAVPIGLSLIFFYAILKYNQKQLRHVRSEVSILRAPSVAHFSETVQGATNIKLAQADRKFTVRFNLLDEIFLKAKQAVFKRVFIFSTQLNVMSFILFLANGFLSIYLVQKNIIGVGQVSIVLGYTVLSTQSLQMFFEWFSQFDEALIGVHRLDEYLRSPLEDQALLPHSAQFKTGHPQEKTSLPPVVHNPVNQNTLRIENVSLKYVGQKNPTLKNLSLTLYPGEKIGIVGATGSGKSSLIAAIMKLYPYSAGSITINNDNLMSLDYYRSHFAVVSQDTFFIQGRLRDNLDLFNLYSDAELTQALQQVRIYLPLDHHIEEKGSNLSFGEKQLISLARCLLGNTPFIILDEATANIDPQSEHVLTQTLETALKDKTQIIVAHRLVTVEKCDRIVWLHQGQIKKIGSVKEVLEAFKTSG